MADNNKKKSNGLWLNGLSPKQVVQAKVFEDGKLTDKDDPNRFMVTIYDKDGNGYRFGLPKNNVPEPKENGRYNVVLFEAKDENGETKQMPNVWKFKAGVENSGERVSMLPSELKALHDENLATSVAKKEAEAEAPEAAEATEGESKYGKALWLNGIDTMNNETENGYNVHYVDKEGRHCIMFASKENKWVNVAKDSCRIFENGQYNVRRQVAPGSSEFETAINVPGSEIHEDFEATKAAQRKYAQAQAAAAKAEEAEAPEAAAEEELEV